MWMGHEAEIIGGIDWGGDRHGVCVLDSDRKVVLDTMVEHSPESLAALCDKLLGLVSDPSKVWIAIEVPHGPVVETLLERGMTVFSINPKQVDRFRDRFGVSGAKDDRRDARVLADSLYTDPEAYRRLEIESSAYIELRQWSRMLEELKEEKARCSNRIMAQLKRFFPHYVEAFPDIAKGLFIDLWAEIRTPEDAQRARARRLKPIFRKNRSRKDPADVLAILQKPPLQVAPGTTESAAAHIDLLVERLAVVLDQIRQCDRKLDALTKRVTAESSEDDWREPSDETILRSCPGVGRIVLATLLAEAARALRERDYQTLRVLCGVAPVTISSGKRRMVVRRYACHRRLREALYHWARVACMTDEGYKALYRRLRAKGKSNGTALRCVGDKLLKALCTMLRNRTLFDRGARLALESAA
jgi:transposase